MFPATFDYHRAETLPDAIRLLAELEDAKVLAGGHSLIPMMKLRLAAPATIVDIGRLAELKGVRPIGPRVAVGALTTHAEVAASPVLREHCPLLCEVAGKIADPQVRNRGTVGGNIAHADPASDLPAALVALDGVVCLVGSQGERRVEAKHFFTDLLTTDVRPAEIITHVEVRAIGRGTGSAYLKFEHPASGYAVCGAAAIVTRGANGRCSDAALCFNGVTATPLVIPGAAALVGTGLDDAAIDGVAAALVVQEPMSDVHFSGPYRVALARTYAKRALRLARDRARA
jgi:carbon-monoxide dehydrogenase medium subunit